MIEKIIHSKYDGYYTVFYKSKVVSYEGKGLCPENVIRWMETHEVEERECFYNEAFK